MFSVLISNDIASFSKTLLCASFRYPLFYFHICKPRLFNLSSYASLSSLLIIMVPPLHCIRASVSMSFLLSIRKISILFLVSVFYHSANCLSVSVESLQIRSLPSSPQSNMGNLVKCSWNASCTSSTVVNDPSIGLPHRCNNFIQLFIHLFKKR